ncbi:MAG TPA: glycoside hydrolase family 3 N-terminal domain-containing protein, partial [Vicinamibacteria bacterium]|nr:glycoside hydrolase family 3 N-terminal domain-containing protein [Vicinamibacteria bacterium]
MTLEEKVLQMSGDTWVWDFLGERLIGRGWKAGADRRRGLPALIYADGPRGVGLGSSTCFPVAMARAASWDRALERRVGEAAGKEMRGHGAQVWLAPCLNLLRHPLWGRAQETYGEDPFLVGEMAAALVEGAQSHNVMACAKHFALNSIEETRRQVDVRADERTLREVYLPHFKRVVDADVATVMTAYNKVNGDYCGESAHLVRDILKDEWGFRGFVVSDWFHAVFDGAKAARAGLDLEMPLVDVFGSKLVAAVSSGQVAPAVVDEAVLRLLRRRIDYAARPDRMAYHPGLVRAAEHVALAREVAESSVVLLKNDGLLPLDRAKLEGLALIGPLADAENLGDRGSSRVRPLEAITLLEGLRAELGPSGRLVHEPGADLG